MDRAFLVSEFSGVVRSLGEVIGLADSRDGTEALRTPIFETDGDGRRPLVGPVGLTFWRMKRLFEREVGVGTGMWYMLVLLDEKDGISQGEFCQRFEVDPSRITRLAQKLEKEGLLERNRDLEDSRIMRMHITEAGRELVREMQGAVGDFDRRVRDALTEEQEERFRETLALLAEAMKR